MDDIDLRNLFAHELEKNNEPALANRVRDGSDNSHGGTAALTAMKAAVSAERERCAAIVGAARCGEVDQDFRAIIHMIEGGSSAEELVERAAH